MIVGMIVIIITTIKIIVINMYFYVINIPTFI